MVLYKYLWWYNKCGRYCKQRNIICIKIAYFIYQQIAQWSKGAYSNKLHYQVIINSKSLNLVAPCSLLPCICLADFCLHLQLHLHLLFDILTFLMTRTWCIYPIHCNCIATHQKTIFNIEYAMHLPSIYHNYTSLSTIHAVQNGAMNTPHITHYMCGISILQ